MKLQSQLGAGRYHLHEAENPVGAGGIEVQAHAGKNRTRSPWKKAGGARRSKRHDPHKSSSMGQWTKCFWQGQRVTSACRAVRVVNSLLLKIKAGSIEAYVYAYCKGDIRVVSVPSGVLDKEMSHHRDICGLKR